jgi:hypothetical protein
MPRIDAGDHVETLRALIVLPSARIGTVVSSPYSRSAARTWNMALDQRVKRLQRFAK